MMRDDVFDNRTERFLRWLEAMPGTRISSKIKVADLRHTNQGRGIVATADIAEGDELFTIAAETILAPGSSTKIFGNQDQGGLSSWDKLILSLIVEYEQAERSIWWPYLDILPTTFDTLMHWSTEELASLQSSAVLSKIGKDAADHHFAMELYPRIQPFLHTMGQTFADCSEEEQRQKFAELCHRLASLILAYGFDLDPESGFDHDEEAEDSDNDDLVSDTEAELVKVMIPLADMCNADGVRNNAHLIHHKDCVTMIAIQDIPLGAQIFNDYGELPRSDLLRRYGYISENYKSWDVAELPLSLVLDVCKRQLGPAIPGLETRLELAESWDAMDEAYDIPRPNVDGTVDIPSELQMTIFALTMQPQTYTEWKEKAEPPKRRHMKPSKSVIDQVLREILQNRLHSYGSTIAEDVVLLKDDSLPHRQRMAIEVRLGEKEILAAALSTLGASDMGSSTGTDGFTADLNRSETSKKIRLESAGQN